MVARYRGGHLSPSDLYLTGISVSLEYKKLPKAQNNFEYVLGLSKSKPLNGFLQSLNVQQGIVKQFIDKGVAGSPAGNPAPAADNDKVVQLGRKEG